MSRERHREQEPGSRSVGCSNQHSAFARCLENLPPGSVSEKAILATCPQCEIRARLQKYNTLLRDGKLRRIVIRGMPYYIPNVKEAAP